MLIHNITQQFHSALLELTDNRSTEEESTTYNTIPVSALNSCVVIFHAPELFMKYEYVANIIYSSFS
jgi:hypothetical protein